MQYLRYKIIVLIIVDNLGEKRGKIGRIIDSINPELS